MNLTSIFIQIKKQFPVLHYFSMIHVVGFFICLLAMLVDERQLMGVNVWLKPSKFMISTFILLWTIGWYLIYFPFRTSQKKFIAIAISLLLSFENILISFQAWRGVQSHYNVSSPLNGMIFGAMGIAVAMITLLMFWFLIQSFSSKLNFSWSMKWGVRIAWITFLFGTALGGKAMLAQNAHAVGVVDGGEGLPFLNWSTEGGDYRIAHFLGLHAIQIIPIVIFFIRKKLTNHNLSIILGISFALIYMAWVIQCYFQAKNGIPML